MKYQRRHDRTRPRGWFNLFLRFGGWACFLFGGLLVVLTFFSASALYLADRMDAEGRLARATVTDKRVAVRVDEDGDESRDYFLTFTYKTRDGGLSTEAKVPLPVHNRLHIGDEHVIRYLNDDPRQVEYEIGQYREKGRILRHIGLGIGLLGLVLLWRFGARTNAAILARRDGDKRYAVITGIIGSGVEVNEREKGRLEWREPDGQTGRSLMHDLDKLRDLYEAGDRIVVFRRGKDAYWEGDVGPPKREFER